MTALTSAPRLPVHRSVLRFVHDRNPFYLLSALCMFVGFRIIMGALNAAPGDWKTLLELVVTLHVYEVAILALALFLIVKRGLLRDGWILLGIDALFLVDLTNLNAELFTAMPRLGAMVSGVSFVLAMAKILVVVRALGLHLATGTLCYIAAQFAFLLGLPGLFRLMQSPMSTISPTQIYFVWWIVAFLIVAGTMIVRRSTSNGTSSMNALPWRLYVLLPFISLLVHLASENRVYWVHFHPANVAPVLLALVVVFNQSKHRHHPVMLAGSLATVAFACLLSIVPDSYQHDLSWRLFGVAMSPLRLELLAAAATLMDLAVRHESLVGASTSCACTLLAGLGTNLSEMSDHSESAGHWLITALLRLVPETDLQWGYVTIATAFLLLGVGAVVSLRKGSPHALAEDTMT